MLLELERLWGDADLASRLSASVEDGRLPGLLLALCAMAAARWAAWPLAKKAASLSWRLARATGRATAWPFRAAPVEPLLAEVVAALNDPHAKYEESDKGERGNAILAAGGMSFFLTVYSGGVVSVEEAEAGGRNVWPDLTAQEQSRARLLAKAALARVTERDRLKSREWSLMAIRGKPGDCWPAADESGGWHAVMEGVEPINRQAPPPAVNTATADNRVPPAGQHHTIVWCETERRYVRVPVPAPADAAAKRDDKKKGGRG